MPEPGELTLATFADPVGDGFRIAVSDELVLPVTQTEAVAVGEAMTMAGGAAAARTPCSIIFSGPADPILAQGIYREWIEHPGSAM
jgi:hypothetical protein